VQRLVHVPTRVHQPLERCERLWRILIDDLRRDDLVNGQVKPWIHRLAADLDLVQASLDRLVQVRMREPDQDRSLIRIPGIQ